MARVAQTVGPVRTVAAERETGALTGGVTSSALAGRRGRGRRARRVWPALSTLFVGLLLALALVPGAGAQSISREIRRDYDVLNGYFFTQTGGTDNQGYAITDDDGIALWSEFQRLGGVDALGYPVSRRFMWDGFVVQATQKVVLQWRPDLGRAVFVNSLDELTRAGKDEWLQTYRQIPPPASFPEEASLPFDQIVQRRLALLEAQPALRAAYLSTPDALTANGLPVAPIADVGPAYVLRAQRKAFQLWKIRTPFAAPGEVTVVNAGDLLKEASVIPATAARSDAASTQIATPPGSTTRYSRDQVSALRQVVEKARPAVVRLSDGESGLGSGIIFDQSGLIMTNSHVVTALQPGKLQATLPDGRSFPAKPLGADDWTDVALVKIDAPSLPWVPLGSAQSLTVGQQVIAIGYAPVFPGAPSAKIGVVRSLAGEIQTANDYPLFDLVTTNAYLHPGDSGGPLLNLNGQLVGINSAIRVPRTGQELFGYAVPVEGARKVVEQIMTLGRVPRPHLGITPQDVTPSLARSQGLPVNRGVLIRQVAPDSPASIAGLLVGDIIVGMDGRTVLSLDDLRRLILVHQIGDAVPFNVLTSGQPRRTVTLTLTERPPLV